MMDLADKLDLIQVMDRNVEHLSGGELQRFAIAVCVASNSDVYMVDEPSSYLDVRQRLKAAQVWHHLQ
jgi:ATP-binding cassette subfamily E protein 1